MKTYSFYCIPRVGNKRIHVTPAFCQCHNCFFKGVIKSVYCKYQCSEVLLFGLIGVATWLLISFSSIVSSSQPSMKYSVANSSSTPHLHIQQANLKMQFPLLPFFQYSGLFLFQWEFMMLMMLLSDTVLVPDDCGICTCGFMVGT